jgi:alpha-galactosidase/6-phospho-beta-glucosidase family protein
MLLSNTALNEFTNNIGSDLHCQWFSLSVGYTAVPLEAGIISGMKTVLIGAGSYVFAPTVLLDMIETHRLEGELVLVDLDLESAELMAAVGRRMASAREVSCQVTASAVRREALRGADFVILSAAPQGARRWSMDFDILQKAGMPDQARECGGLGGLSYALRTISLALDIAEDMAELCPSALLLDVTNPMPRVVTALQRFTPITAYGFCNAAQEGEKGYEWLAKLVGRQIDEIEVVTAGLNHFSWLVSIEYRPTGENLYPIVERAVRQSDNILRRLWLERYGAICVVGSRHAAEFLPYDTVPSHRTSPYPAAPPFHGSSAERQQRLAHLRAISSGTLDWHTVFKQGSWEHPVDLIAALSRGKTLHMPMLNLPNQNYLSDILVGRIVEVPTTVRQGQVRGDRVGRLPGCIGEICQQISTVHERVAEGAASGKRKPLEEAIAMDPAIGAGKTAAALQVLDELIAAHRDILPRFDA